MCVLFVNECVNVYACVTVVCPLFREMCRQCSLFYCFVFLVQFKGREACRENAQKEKKAACPYGLHSPAG